MLLYMPVGKGFAPPFVIRTRKVCPIIIVQGIDAKTIIDRIRMFVEKNENSGGILDLGILKNCW